TRRHANLVQDTGNRWHIALDLLQDAINPPDEDSTIPDVISSLQVLLRDLARRLLFKRVTRIGAEIPKITHRRAVLYISVSSLRRRWRHAKGDQRSLARELLGEGQRLRESRDIGDHVVGVEGAHDGMGIARGDQRGGEANGGRRPATRWLGDDLLTR